VTSLHVTLTASDGIELQFPYNYKNNIPFMCVGKNPLKEAGLGTVHFRAMNEAYSDPEICSLLDSTSNLNLKANQKELLLWHWRLEHTGQDWIQSLMATPKQEVGERPPVKLTQRAKSVELHLVVHTQCVPHVSLESSIAEYQDTCGQTQIRKWQSEERPYSQEIALPLIGMSQLSQDA
jgi:hypothetical protein